MYRKGRRQQGCPRNKNFIPYTKQFKNLIRRVFITVVVVVVNNNNSNNNNNNISVPNTHNLAKTLTDKQNKYQELANEICAMWNQKAAQMTPIVISSTGSNFKVAITKSNKTQTAPECIHTTAKICNSWRMFNFKKLFELQIRPPSLILLSTTFRDR